MSYYLPFPDEPITNPALFVGRERDVVAAAALLNDGRSLALVGPRGAGASSLLHHLVQTLPVLHDDPPAVAHFDLAALREPGEIYQTALRALGVLGTTEIELEQALGERPLLLALDNLDRPGAGWTAPLQSALRSWVKAGSVQLLLAAQRPLAESAPSLAGIVSEHPLGPLPDREARALLELLAQRAEVTIPPAAQSEIIAVAGGMPGDLRRALELYLRSRAGAEFEWQRTLREERPHLAGLGATVVAGGPAVEAEPSEADQGVRARMMRQIRQSTGIEAGELRPYELDPPSPMLFWLVLFALLALVALVLPTWPLRLAGLLVALLLLVVLLPWWGRRSGWERHEWFQGYLAALGKLPVLGLLSGSATKPTHKP